MTHAANTQPTTAAEQRTAQVAAEIRRQQLQPAPLASLHRLQTRQPVLQTRELP